MRMLFLTLTVLTSSATAADIVLLPGEFTLDGPEARQRLLLQRAEGDDYREQVTDGVTYASSNEGVVKVQGVTAVPVGDGTARITATAGDQTASADVTVTGMGDGNLGDEKPFAWSFSNHVLPVLSKAGCNSGACHGALAGKGGFKLSLHGYDPERDHYVITREARGRRIEPGDPGRSLLLAKPTGAVPHKGGLRFDTDSLAYRVIAEWITAGAAPPTDADAELERLEVLPGRVMLKPGQTQQVLVRAHYSDGRSEDVTHWAKYTSTNEAVCRIDQDGRISVIGYGEGAVTAWFSSQIAIARVTVPYDQTIPAEVYASAERRNFIDELVLKQLQRLNLKPSPPADDAAFLRRAFVDTIGTLPTPSEVREFLADPDPDKRDRLIERLLAREEFADYWTHKWSDILLLNGTKLRPEALKAYYEWIHGHVERNTPWDEFVRQIVTARGSSHENGATNFYALHQTPEEMTENVSQALLGLSIGCAKCHNHPLEKWTNSQYYAMANMFARVRTKGWGGEPRNGDGLRTLYVAASGDLVQPLTGKPQPPTPLDGEPLPFDDPTDRRVALAEWLTAPENPYFARSITNRVWENFYGVGLVEDVDDMRASNPASNEELLSAAADYLIEQDFDLKALMRAILQSATYQRSSRPLPENADEGRFYSRYYPRRMKAEVLLDAVSQVTNVPTEFTEIEFPGADVRKTEFYPKGTRAIELYDSAVRSYFLQAFGRNPRDITCECERSDQSSMIQVLHLSNGETLNGKLRAKDNRIDALLASEMPPGQLIEEAYLLALARRPTVRERDRLSTMLTEAAADEKRIVVEDLFWALLTSKEFMFNH